VNFSLTSSSFTAVVVLSLIMLFILVCYSGVEITGVALWPDFPASMGTSPTIQFRF
jgi:hypothetical protein